KLMAFARINMDGTPDTGFGGAGNATLTLAPTTVQVVYGLSQQPDGKLVAATTTLGADLNFTVLRLTPQGTLDTTFGGGGDATIDMAGQDYAFGTAIDAKGRIIATGQHSNALNGWGMVSGRFAANGAVDTSFAAPTGWVQTIDGAADHAFGWTVLVQPDGH